MNDINNCLETEKFLPVVSSYDVNNLDTNIISVISNKGGVGKTSLAVCAGFYYSVWSDAKTLVLELDSSPGDFGPIFDIGPSVSLEMALKFPESFKNYRKNLKENLDVMKGLSDPIAAEGVGRENLYNLISNLCSEYKNIIFDTQTVLNSLTLDVLVISKTILLVTDCSLESMTRILNLFEILTKKFLIKNTTIKLIFNKKRFFDFFRVWDFCKITDMPIEGFISYDAGFNKMLFMSNFRKVFVTKIYKQLAGILKNGSKG